MEPKLALVYTSGAGNGPLGQGWGFEGFSAIARCPRTIAQDGIRGSVNYDWNDRYCLDGQRLVLVAGASYGADGSEYRTESESFTKLVSYGTAGNGPAWFRAWTKSGQIIEYGNSAGSRVEAQGSATVRVWAANKVSDIKGNYFTITYSEDIPNGLHYPNQIDYTGALGLSPTASIRFFYESRTDVETTYAAGSVVRLASRASKVATYLGESVVREYRFAYDNFGTVGRSRIIGIQECLADSTCMSPLTFTWATETAATRSFGGTGSGNWAGHSNAGLILQGDFNGDGKQDVARYTGSSSHDVCLSTGSNYSCSTWPSSNATWPSTVGDFNGDGRSDIGGYAITFVQQGKTPDGEIFGYYRHHIFVCLNSGSAFPCTQWKADAFNVNGFSGEPPAYNGIVADFNGDGRSDWAYWHQASSSWMVCLSTGGGFNCGAWNGPTTGIGANVAGDFNGDGMEDLLGSAGGSNWKVCLSSGAGFSCSTWPGADSSAWPVFGDFNGDGLQDMARYVSGSNWNVCLSTGSGFSCANWSGMVVPAESYTKTGDFNGDGKKDLARSLGGGSWNVCLSTGSGFSCSTWTGTSATFEATFIGDFNGDGKDDLTGYLSGSTWNTTLAGDPFPDLTTGISNSLGNTVSLVYRPLTAAEVYSKDTDATLPNQDLQPATHVVRMQTLDNGAGGTSATNYFYKGLKRNFDRAALLGFREVEETETLTGNKIAVSRRQDWPYAGLPSVVRRTQSSGAILTETTNTYSCKNPATGAACTVAAGNRYFPYVSQSVETGNDLNGAALPTLTTSTEYDLYGNATTITAGTGDGYSKTTTNVFTNDVPNWLLGRLTRSTVQSISP